MKKMTMLVNVILILALIAIGVTNAMTHPITAIICLAFGLSWAMGCIVYESNGDFRKIMSDELNRTTNSTGPCGYVPVRVKCPKCNHIHDANETRHRNWHGGPM